MLSDTQMDVEKQWNINHNIIYFQLLFIIFLVYNFDNKN